MPSIPPEITFADFRQLVEMLQTTISGMAGLADRIRALEEANQASYAAALALKDNQQQLFDAQKAQQEVNALLKQSLGQTAGGDRHEPLGAVIDATLSDCSSCLARTPLFAQAPGRQKRSGDRRRGDARPSAPPSSSTPTTTSPARPSRASISASPTDHMTDVAAHEEGRDGRPVLRGLRRGELRRGNRSANRALQMIDTVRHDIVERYPNDFLFATTAEDIRRAGASTRSRRSSASKAATRSRTACGCCALYYDAGRPVHDADPLQQQPLGGLVGRHEQAQQRPRAFGKEVVAEMNRLGMIVDISHVADKTFWDALEVSKAPIFASHSSCRAISPVPRNMTDEMIVALAKKGGVVQINFSCDFLNAEVAKANAATRRQGARRARPADPEIRERSGWPAKGAWPRRADSRRDARPRATLADVVKHINHVVEIAGVDAVGIGSDFDGIGCAPEGLDSVDKWPNLTRALLEEGYTAAEIRKIYGENTLRLMEAVERRGKATLN